MAQCRIIAPWTLKQVQGDDENAFAHGQQGGVNLPAPP
jgi:hypothetical protein